MNWFKKFFNKDEEEYVDVLSVPVTTILRWYLYDTAISDEKELSDLIGLSPISDEGEAKELEDSEDRLSELGFILPYLDAMSDISANFITTIHAKEAAKIEGVALQESDLEAMLSTYKLVAFSTLVGTLSIAVNLGLLRPGNVASEPDMEGFFDE